MVYLICFDISDNRVRYRAVKALKGVGVRIQKSVFLCPKLSEKQFLDLKDRLEAVIDHAGDTVHYVRICRACLKEMEWSGQGGLPSGAPFLVV